jgi:hypothetical protein
MRELLDNIAAWDVFIASGRPGRPQTRKATKEIN